MMRQDPITMMNDLIRHEADKRAFFSHENVIINDIREIRAVVAWRASLTVFFKDDTQVKFIQRFDDYETFRRLREAMRVK